MVLLQKTELTTSIKLETLIYGLKIYEKKHRNRTLILKNGISFLFNVQHRSSVQKFYALTLFNCLQVMLYLVLCWLRFILPFYCPLNIEVYDRKSCCKPKIWKKAP